MPTPTAEPIEPVTPSVATPSAPPPASPFRGRPEAPERPTNVRAATSSLDRGAFSPLVATRREATAAPAAAPTAAAGASAEIVADAVGRAIEQNRPIRVRLDPPELGTVRVEVSAGRGDDAGAVRVRLTAAEPAGRAVLHEALPRLRESLVAAGLSLDSIDLDSATRPERADGGRESGRDADRREAERRDGESGGRREPSERGSNGRSSDDSQGERERQEPSGDEPPAPEGSGGADSADANAVADPPAPAPADATSVGADWSRPRVDSFQPVTPERSIAGSLDVAA